MGTVLEQLALKQSSPLVQVGFEPDAFRFRRWRWRLAAFKPAKGEILHIDGRGVFQFASRLRIPVTVDHRSGNA
jgi:hypothetical protein